MESGYLYVASGEKYLKEAERSASSLREHTVKHPIALITDQLFQSSSFDHILKTDLPDPSLNPKNGYLVKMVGMLQSPFSKTLFVDTDTFFCDACDELFDVLDYFDLMICHDYQEHTFAKPNGRELTGFNTYNTGVIAFRNTNQTESFLNQWIEIFKKKIDDYWSDQPAFMEALLFQELKTYSLQTIYNFRFNQFLPISQGKVKVLHGRHEDMRGIGKILNQSTNHRSWDPRDWRCRSWQDLPSARERLSKLLSKFGL